MNKTIEVEKVKQQGKIMIILLLISGIIFPIILNFNILCQITMALTPLLTAAVLSVLFYLDFNHWPWQKEKKSKIS